MALVPCCAVFSRFYFSQRDSFVCFFFFVLFTGSGLVAARRRAVVVLQTLFACSFFRPLSRRAESDLRARTRRRKNDHHPLGSARPPLDPRPGGSVFVCCREAGVQQVRGKFSSDSRREEILIFRRGKWWAGAGGGTAAGRSRIDVKGEGEGGRGGAGGGDRRAPPRVRGRSRRFLERKRDPRSGWVARPSSCLYGVAGMRVRVLVPPQPADGLTFYNSST